MRHGELNDIGMKFLKTNRTNFHRYKCQFIYKELKTSANEIPDVVGLYSGSMVIIESKTSKADFNRDKNKYHRLSGAGDYRFFLCKENLLTAEDLYDDRGLLYTDGKKTWIVKEPQHRGRERDKQMDILIMYSIIRRLKNK